MVNETPVLERFERQAISVVHLAVLNDRALRTKIIVSQSQRYKIETKAQVRSIRNSQAKVLGGMFKVSPSLFIRAVLIDGRSSNIIIDRFRLQLRSTDDTCSRSSILAAE